MNQFTIPQLENLKQIRCQLCAGEGGYRRFIGKKQADLICSQCNGHGYIYQNQTPARHP